MQDPATRAAVIVQQTKHLIGFSLIISPSSRASVPVPLIQNDRLESDALPAFRSRRSSRSPAAANPLDTAHYATAWLRREPFSLDELAGLVPVILLGNARTGGEPAHGVPAGGFHNFPVWDRCERQTLTAR